MGQVPVVRPSNLGVSTPTLPSTITPTSSDVSDTTAIDNSLNYLLPVNWATPVFEEPVKVELDGLTYEAILDPFNLSEAGQTFVKLNYADLDPWITYSSSGYGYSGGGSPIENEPRENLSAYTFGFILPSLGSGRSLDLERLYIIEYIDKDTGAYVTAVFRDSELGAILVIENVPNYEGIIGYGSINAEFLSSDLARLLPDSEPDTTTVNITNGISEQLNLGDFALPVKNELFDDDFEVIPTLEPAATTGEYIPTARTYIGSLGKDGYFSEPGNTVYLSTGNDDTVSGEELDEIDYSSSPGPITVAFDLGLVTDDGWGFQDTFSANEFEILGSHFADTYQNIETGSIYDLAGDDYYQLQGSIRSAFIGDMSGANYIDIQATQVASMEVGIGLFASKVYGSGYYAQNAQTLEIASLANCFGYETVIESDFMLDYDPVKTLSDFLSGSISHGQFEQELESGFISDGLVAVQLALPLDDTIPVEQASLAFFLDDAFSGFHNDVEVTASEVAQLNAQRVNGVSAIMSGDSHDLIDLTSEHYSIANSMMIRTYAGDDIVWGSAGNDMILTDEGDDKLFGGSGNNLLAGGEGNDIFQFVQPVQGEQQDAILDFNYQEDRIQFFHTASDPKAWNLSAEGVISWGDLDINLYDYSGTNSDLNIEFVLI